MNHPLGGGSPYYTWLMWVGLAVSLAFWVRLARRDERLLTIWLGALLGAFAGAKLVYLAAEGWGQFRATGDWRRLGSGQSIVGALLGGYALVEGVKKLVGYRQTTGDAFAVVVPLGTALGRIGCGFGGCCLGQPCAAPAWWTLADGNGVPRWPAVPLEFAFNGLACLILAGLRRAGKFPGNLFHLYLIAYGLFRFAHELLRDTPRWWGPFSGYSVAAAAVAGLGFVRFRQRRAGKG